MKAVRLHFFLVAALLAATRPAYALLPSDQLSQYGRQGWQTGNGLPQNTVTAIAQTADGYLWIGTEAGLARFDGYSFSVPSSLQRESIQALWMAHGTLWVRDSSRTLQLVHDQFIPAAGQPPAARFSTPPGLQAQPTCGLTDRQGAVWIGTNHGLLRAFHGKLESFGPGDPLSAAEILALFEDSEGDLWAGTADAGLQLIKAQRFDTYTTDRIRCVLGSRNQAWLGTDSNGLLQFSNGNVSPSAPFSADVILSLASGPGGLLIGTTDGLRMPNGKQRLTSADGLPDDFVRSLFIDTDGSVWAGTRRGLAHIQGSLVTTYTQTNGLGSDLVGAIVRDRQGTLWVATLHGLSKWNGSAFTTYTVSDGLSSNVITDLYPDADGYLWIATQGGGLNRFRDEMFTRASAPQGIPDTLYGVTDDQNGNLWLAAESGIYRVSKQDFGRLGPTSNEPLRVMNYGVADGLRLSECIGGGHPGVWKDRAGDVWFATARGAAFLSAEHAAMRDPKPKPVIELVGIDDAQLAPAALSDIQPGHPRIAIQYAGISFSNQQRVRYHYRLDGFDSEWIDAGTRRTAFYTNLGPGEYTFRLSAALGQGNWSTATPATLSFRVLPHAYQTWWFRLLLLCAVALVVYAVVRWRIHRVRTEFRAVLNERTRIAREIHDTLAQGFAGISVQLELVSRMLAASPEKARGHLDQARSLARSCLDDARRTIWDLRSQNADAEELPSRLSKLVRDAQQTSGINMQFQVRGTYRPLAARTENELARIAQEALANAVRHSGAVNVYTDLTFEDDRVRLTISDDGCGMKPTSVRIDSPDGHYGLTGMRERAENIGAVLSITSKEGSGSTIQVEAVIG